MIRTILFALLVVASVTYGAVVPVGESNIESKSANRFTFIGSSKNLISKAKGKSSATYQESLYFLSQNAAGQEMANMDCVNIFGPDGSLVSIETQEEHGNITQFLRASGDSGTLYWTSGRFNIDDRVFEWGNGVQLSPSAPWSANHPNSQLSVTRVALYTVGSPKLRTQFNTVSSRYICEVKLGEVGEEAEPCYSDNDLVIVVDSSGSIGQVNYLSALEFAAKLATAWVDNSNNRISVVIYSNSVQSVIGLGESVTVSQIRDRVYNAPYLSGGTASDLGINKAVTEFQSNARAVPKNLVFLTDGVSNSPSATLAAAQKATAAGIRSFSVGITTNINQQELLAIAGNDASHVFNTDGFEDLLKLLQPVSRRVCA
ncbi:Vitrin [Orchesella cincta]|uniref:Vitrin n=1 Tax=Orchesella cincta TaxID=48709 RepID=A0A1D2N0U1_ORCCI|nr:Vitrin [Orchesella cincta]